jgi:hypothetical protein
MVIFLHLTILLHWLLHPLFDCLVVPPRPDSLFRHAHYIHIVTVIPIGLVISCAFFYIYRSWFRIFVLTSVDITKPPSYHHLLSCSFHVRRCLIQVERVSFGRQRQLMLGATCVEKANLRIETGSTLDRQYAGASCPLPGKLGNSYIYAGYIQLKHLTLHVVRESAARCICRRLPKRNVMATRLCAAQRSWKIVRNLMLTRLPLRLNITSNFKALGRLNDFIQNLTV